MQKDYSTTIKREDILHAYLLSAFVMVGLFFIQSWRGIMQLIDEETYTYTIEYIRGLEGFRDSYVVANISLLMFWGLLGLAVYCIGALSSRSILSARHFYIVERYYVHKRPFKEDLKQVIAEFMLMSLVFIVSLLALFIILPVLFDVFLMNLIVSSFFSAMTIGLIVYILIGVIFIFIKLLHRQYISIRINGLPQTLLHHIREDT